jgi:hypothetical protein
VDGLSLFYTWAPLVAVFDLKIRGDIGICPRCIGARQMHKLSGHPAQHAMAGLGHSQHCRKRVYRVASRSLQPSIPSPDAKKLYWTNQPPPSDLSESGSKSEAARPYWAVYRQTLVAVHIDGAIHACAHHLGEYVVNLRRSLQRRRVVLMPIVRLGRAPLTVKVRPGRVRPKMPPRTAIRIDARHNVEGTLVA